MTDTARKESEASIYFDKGYEAGRAAGRAEGWKERGKVDLRATANLLSPSVTCEPLMKAIRALNE